MTIPEEFNDIRPYTPEELPAVYQELIADEEFKAVMAKVMPDVPFEMLAKQLLQCKTNLEFQKALVYPLLKSLVAKCGKGMEMNADSLTDRDRHHTFISNHRDIVLDSALLSVLLVDNGFDTTVEIAIGDNLLIRPWIKKIVRINKSFIVQRALTMRQMLQASATMSRYMHFAINHKNENIWMAQREGRAKDSNDLTQDSILKMLAMGGEGDIIDRLKDMNIVPLSISYEFDPCDYLKAKEFQQKRDNPDFKKSQQDDLDNMSIGIYGFKGHIHYHTAPCINEWLDTIDRST
ncbi:MAG: 1-acyl-sn-glycerol-3-phosphate acyltransferase, partial [Bacteroidaceae bacterium]|nr:1-acyl-sn-glycerol-3-phosphate acyltransferase [Bacteroidaceae bacterium]